MERPPALSGTPAASASATLSVRISARPFPSELGWRILVPEELRQKVADLIGAELADSADYEAHRIAAGVPRGGLAIRLAELDDLRSTPRQTVA